MKNIEERLLLLFLNCTKSSLSYIFQKWQEILTVSDTTLVIKFKQSRMTFYLQESENGLSNQVDKL